jgi:hypothetical protein
LTSDLRKGLINEGRGKRNQLATFSLKPRYFMDKDTQFAVLVIGIPFLGLAYCALIFVVMAYWTWARQHPISMATFFVLAPSLVSGSIWLLASFKARQSENLGL